MTPNSNYCCNVLIVDDNESVCRSLEMIVQNLGHKACSALTGHSAIEQIKNHILDIAFVDHDLPDMDGVILIDEIKKKDENPDVFMIMPESSVHRTELVIREDISGVIKKPIVMEEILLVVETTATKRKLLRENRDLKNQINEFKLQLEISSLAISHDAINDLQLLLGRLDLISQDPQNLNMNSIDLCFAVAKRMAILLNLFKEHDPDRPMNFLNLVKELTDSYMSVFPKMRIKIICKNSADFQLPSGSKMLIFVFNNLLSNIIKHASKAAEVEIIISRGKDRVLIDIQDNGPGVVSHIKDKLFEYGTSTTDGGRGLYLSRRVIEYLGGTIELLPTTTGARFRITLPVISQRKWTFH